MYPYMGENTQTNVQISNYSYRFMHGYIQDGRIFADAGQGLQQIGVTSEIYSSMENTAFEYRDRLIELGEIEVPLTQEQINEKLMSELKSVKEERTELTALIKTLANQLASNEVNNGSEKSNNGSNTGNVTNDIISDNGTGESN